MLEKDHKITISSPRDLRLGCPGIESESINCGHAFPDLTKFEDHYFLAFRSAPTHFPSRNSRIQLLRSDDTHTWQHESSFTAALDVRDPQFLQFNGSLYVFFMSYNLRLFNHEPVNIYYSKRTDAGWSDPAAIPISGSGFWNLKVRDGRVYMSIYTRNGDKDRRVKRHFALVSSHNLMDWKYIFSSPITREHLQNYQTSETTFDFDEHGNIFGTIRSLIYPNLNFKINRDQPQDWQIRIDRFKCDGPKLFTFGGRHYLIARRSEFYKLRTEPFRLFNGWRSLVNVIRYSLSKKRTALYQFDPEGLEISHIQDLPSHGDTGYSAITPINDKELLLIYYSSDISSGQDHLWLRGQFAGRTKLYAATVTFSN